MKKSEINEWLSVAGSFSVVAGIIFLGFELHQNNELLEQQARDVFLQNRITWAEDQYRDRSFTESLVRVWNGDEVSEAERHQIIHWHLSMYLKWEWEYEQYVQGDLVEIPLEAWRYVFREYPLTDEAWALYGTTMSAEFGQFVTENVITQN